MHLYYGINTFRITGFNRKVLSHVRVLCTISKLLKLIKQLLFRGNGVSGNRVGGLIQCNVG